MSKQEEEQQFDQKTMPNEFLCPIFQQIMKDPVLTADGFTFERRSITEWFSKGKITNPLTNQNLSSTTLIPNRALKQIIEHHRTRMREIQIKTNENVQKIIKTQNERFACIYPELVDECGYLDLDKFTIYSNENVHVRNVLKSARQKFGSLQKCCDKGASECQGCRNFVEAIKVYTQFVMKEMDETLKMGFVVNKQVFPEKLQYFIINTELVKKIDYKRIKRDEIKKLELTGIMLTALSIQVLVTRIRNQLKIPKQDFIRIWITNYELGALYDHIVEQVETTTSSYLCKVKCVGRKVKNIKTKYSQSEIKEGEYMLIEHGPGEEFIFREDNAKCDYCYNMKKIEKFCDCKKVFYCSIDCLTKDKIYHDNVCKLQQKTKV